MSFKLKNDHTTGVCIIDYFHRETLKWLNFLSSTMNSGKGEEVMNGVMSSLINYYANHFAIEEMLMLNHGYDHYQLQEAKHSQIMRDCHALKDEFKTGSATLHSLIRIQQWLSGTVLDHIRNEDKKFGVFLKKCMGKECVTICQGQQWLKRYLENQVLTTNLQKN